MTRPLLEYEFCRRLEAEDGTLLPVGTFRFFPLRMIDFYQERKHEPMKYGQAVHDARNTAKTLARWTEAAIQLKRLACIVEAQDKELEKREGRVRKVVIDYTEADRAELFALLAKAPCGTITFLD